MQMYGKLFSYYLTLLPRGRFNASTTTRLQGLKHIGFGLISPRQKETLYSLHVHSKFKISSPTILAYTSAYKQGTEIKKDIFLSCRGK
jgi:hypothetical protein